MFGGNTFASQQFGQPFSGRASVNVSKTQNYLACVANNKSLNILSKASILKIKWQPLGYLQT
jgi:hypothetical protein